MDESSSWSRVSKKGSVEAVECGLRVMIDGDRMRGYVDAERVLRVDELFRLAALESSEPPGGSSERFACRVAGERSVRVPSQPGAPVVRARWPWAA